MAKFTINSERIDELILGITKAKDVISTKSLKPKMEKLFKSTLEILKKETPKSDAARPDWHTNSKFSRGDKHLKDHWKYKIETKGTTVISGEIVLDDESLWDLVNLLEAGSRPHRIPTQGRTLLKFYKRVGSSWELRFAMHVTHPGFKANRFTDRTFIQHEKITKLLQVKIEKDFFDAIHGRLK
jgi:hypothetical protein